MKPHLKVSLVRGLFSHFLIAGDKFPDFWIFMYWLNPLHYSSIQFKDDHTLIKTSNWAVTDRPCGLHHEGPVYDLEVQAYRKLCIGSVLA
eukprot:scaffold974_cov176-Ochromonas_danica.AAC.5